MPSKTPSSNRRRTSTTKSAATKKSGISKTAASAKTVTTKTLSAPPRKAAFKVLKSPFKAKVTISKNKNGQFLLNGVSAASLVADPSTGRFYDAPTRPKHLSQEKLDAMVQAMRVKAR